MRMTILRHIRKIDLMWCQKSRDQRDWSITDRFLRLDVCKGQLPKSASRWKLKNVNLRICRQRMEYVRVREGSRSLVCT